MSERKRLNSFVNEELLVPYYHIDEEYEWLKMETEALIQLCKQYKIAPSFKSFNWESGYIPVRKPDTKLEEVCWYIDMNKAYNTRLVRYLKHQKLLADNEKYEEEKRLHEKYCEAVQAFWDGLMVNNYQVFREFRNSKLPHIMAEAKRQEMLFVDKYLHQGIDMFVSCD